MPVFRRTRAGARRRIPAALLSSLAFLIPRDHPLAQSTGHAAHGASLPAADSGAARNRHDSGSAAPPPQMQMPSMHGVLGISHARRGSGTSWLPDATPIHAIEAMRGPWMLMFHGAAFAQYDDQGSTRGDRQFGVVDWAMLMAERPLLAGQVTLRGMFSLEPATLGGSGYPLLLQSGESYHGVALHDRQHPHDAFMELAAEYQRPSASNLAWSLYAGAVGEPALGPVAFMHRPSAQNDPLAPLGHHWQDATHIAFGVLTAGIFSRIWKLEGSVFNGREPDENRWNFDYHGRRLDSFAGRISVNPARRVSASAWYGFLKSPEALHPDESIHRFGAALLLSAPAPGSGEWTTSLVWGANRSEGRTRHSLLAESNLELGARTTVFGRVEAVRKSAEDLQVPGVDPATAYDLRAVSLGAVRQVATSGSGTVGVGAAGTLNVVPPALRSVYGTRTPKGVVLFARLGLRRSAGGMSMPGMHMPSAAPAGREVGDVAR